MKLKQINNNKGDVNNIESKGIGNTAINNKKIKSNGIMSKLFGLIKKIFIR